jgi:catechol 2,3-dioxygenase-like lactoylglutathione lyase family enzyme
VIQHVSIELRRDDIADAVAFWGLLGFEPIEAPGTLGEHSTWVAREGQHVHLMHRDEPVAPRDGHIALHLPEFEAVCSRLRDAGYEPEPRERHWGAARVFVRGPGGHRVELREFPPP